MEIESPSLPPLKCALFVDFDNIYIGLGKNDPASAERFAADPHRWLSWLEAGLPIRSGGADGPPRRRSILIRRCYPNPDAGFRRYRSFFTSAAFSVIDCPTLTRTGKNSSDIYMVMDILDTLNHKTHFDEFIIFSGDSDFMPVLLRLRAYDRRTTTLAIDFMPPAFKAACDLVINEEDFIEDALGLSQETNGRAKVSLPVLKQMAQRVIDVIRQNGDVSGADLPDILKDFREFRDSTNWLGYGTSHRLAEALIAQETRLELVRVNSIQYKLALKPATASISLQNMHLASVVSKGRPSEHRSMGHFSQAQTTARPIQPAHHEQPSHAVVAHDDEAFEESDRTAHLDDTTPLRSDASEDQTTAEVTVGETSPQYEELKRQVVDAVREVVTGSRGPVLLARASQFVVSKLGARVLDSQWAGSGSFKKLLQSVDNLGLEITTQPEPGYIYDPTRHNHPSRRAPRLSGAKPPRADAVTDLRTNESSDEEQAGSDKAVPYSQDNESDAPYPQSSDLGSDLDMPLEMPPDDFLPDMPPELYLEARTSLQEFARRVSQVTGAPMLTPYQYALVFNGVVAELQQIATGQKTYSTYQSSKSVSDWCRTAGESIAHTDIALIFKGIIFQDSVRFGKQPGSYTAPELAHVVRDNLLSLCQRARLELSEYEYQLMDNWILDGLEGEDSQAHGAADS